MYHIDLKNDFCGVYLTVAFVDGKGTTEIEHIASTFEMRGYTVTQEEAEPEVPTPVAPTAPVAPAAPAAKTPAKTV